MFEKEKDRKILIRIFALIASIILVGLSGLVLRFGYAITREAVEDGCYMTGGSIDFKPATHWIGIVIFLLIGTAYLLAKALNRSMGTILTILLVIFGGITIALPLLLR
jgi:hypothetical protein